MRHAADSGVLFIAYVESVPRNAHADVQLVLKNVEDDLAALFRVGRELCASTRGQYTHNCLSETHCFFVNEFSNSDNSIASVVQIQGFLTFKAASFTE
eukprot:IDg21703t1